MSKPIPAKYRRAIGLVERFASVIGDTDANLAMKAMALKARLRLTPMDKILDQVPGDTVTAKCQAIRISRQTYYYWLNGVCRPNQKQARRLAFLTGYDMDDIRGKFRITPPR